MTTWGFKGNKNRALELPAGQDTETSPSGRARLRYNDTAKQMEQSVDGGSYTPLGGTGAGPWDQVGTNVFPDSTGWAVIVGASAPLGSEKLRVVGDVGIQGDIALEIGASRTVGVSDSPDDASGTDLNLTAGAGGDAIASPAGLDGGVTQLTGGDGGAGSVTAIGGNGGNVVIAGGAAGSDGGAGPGSFGDVNLGVTSTNQVNIGSATVGVSLGGSIVGDINYLGFGAAKNLSVLQSAAGTAGVGLIVEAGQGGDESGAVVGAGAQLALEGGDGGAASGAAVVGGAGGAANLIGGEGGAGGATALGGAGADAFVVGGAAGVGGSGSGAGGFARVRGGIGTPNGDVLIGDVNTRSVEIGSAGGLLGFYGTSGVSIPSITGALSTVTDAAAKAVLTSIIAALASAAGVGLVVDSTT